MSKEFSYAAEAEQEITIEELEVKLLGILKQVIIVVLGGKIH